MIFTALIFSRGFIEGASVSVGKRLRDVSGQITDIIERELAGVGKFCNRLGRGRYQIC